MSSNVIKFPERRSSQQNAPEGKERRQTKRSVDRRMIWMFLIGLSLFSLNYKFFNGDVHSEIAAQRDGRTVASQMESTYVEKGFSHIDLARRLASTEVQDLRNATVGVDPSVEDRVRHEVLGSRPYVVQKSLEEGNVISVQLQSDSDVPAYFLDPQAFVTEYGPWLNADFQSADLIKEESTDDKKISHFVIHTKTGEEFAVRIERDVYQRLKSISQTQVAGNSFN